MNTAGRFQNDRASGDVSGRRVLLASADVALRQRLCSSLTAMRWKVVEAGAGAEAVAHLDQHPHDALLLDDWLPDLDAGELARELAARYPGLEVLRKDGSAAGPRGAQRHELLHALREAQDAVAGAGVVLPPSSTQKQRNDTSLFVAAQRDVPSSQRKPSSAVSIAIAEQRMLAESDPRIDGMVGDSAVMLDLARLLRLVAPRSTTVLVEGETGTGKEIVAQALHRLSARVHKPFAVLNCAAIPEALLEAEIFGHTRGAFTGAVQSRTGRIEAADGGTLFLDEIGEMLPNLQAKLLRFLECGELQRVGDNATVHVDVRVIAATHRNLEERSAEGLFRLDLYHRLAVFPIEVPSLRHRKEDIPLLAEHFLLRMARSSLRKHLLPAALEKLMEYDWPGNVRELSHVLERATILAGESDELSTAHIRLRRAQRQRYFAA